MKNSAKQDENRTSRSLRLTVVYEFHDFLVLRTLTGLLLLLHVMLTVVMHLVLVLVLSLRWCMKNWLREATRRFAVLISNVHSPWIGITYLISG